MGTDEFSYNVKCPFLCERGVVRQNGTSTFLFTSATRVRLLQFSVVFIINFVSIDVRRDSDTTGCFWILSGSNLHDEDAV
jgi:hypothetical protein